MSQETKNTEQVEHPQHYGGKDNIYEVIKIAEYYNTDLYIFNLLKYCLRAGVKNKSTEIEDLKKGAWYLQRKIDRLQAQKEEKLQELSNEFQEKWDNDVSPKLISDLKVGDMIKAIKNCFKGGDQLFEKDKIYIVKKGINGLFGIDTESKGIYIIETEDLHEYFHVSKE